MAFGLKTSTTTLSIAGPETATVPLTMLGPIPVSGSLSLFTQGPEANSLSLWIGKDVNSSESAPLYIQTPWATGSPGSVLTQLEAPLSTSGTTYYNYNTIIPLSISAPSVGSGIGNITLLAATDDPSLPGGEVPVSGQMTIVVSGEGAASQDKNTTLFIRVEDVSTSGISMYIERATAEMIPLSITSKVASGVFPVAISGAFIGTSSTSLYMQSPTAKALTTFMRGYLE